MRKLTHAFAIVELTCTETMNEQVNMALTFSSDGQSVYSISFRQNKLLVLQYNDRFKPNTHRSVLLGNVRGCPLLRENITTKVRCPRTSKHPYSYRERENIKTKVPCRSKAYVDDGMDIVAAIKLRARCFGNLRSPSSLAFQRLQACWCLKRSCARG